MNDCIYDRNKTMKMIGQQPNCGSFGENVGNELREILNAHLEDGILNMSLTQYAMHAFLLGTIYGKRAERSRRNSKM